MIGEIANGRYCKENGYFCPFMDRSGYCIATNCKHMTDILVMNELERKAQYETEIKEGKAMLMNDKLCQCSTTYPDGIDIEED